MSKKESYWVNFYFKDGRVKGYALDHSGEVDNFTFEDASWWIAKDKFKVKINPKEVVYFEIEMSLSEESDET